MGELPKNPGAVPLSGFDFIHCVNRNLDLVPALLYDANR